MKRKKNPNPLQFKKTKLFSDNYIMLPFPIRKALKALLIEIGKQEKQLEVLKQILCEQYDFEPYSAFQRLDDSRTGLLTPPDISKFLAANEFGFTEDDCALFLRHYAFTDPNSLTYAEYIKNTILNNDNFV